MTILPIAHARAKPLPWIVLKFGGTSVSTRARWDKIAAIAKDWVGRGKRVVIVVSALSGITDKLKALCDAQTDASTRAALRDEIVARHRAMFDNAGQCMHATAAVVRVENLGDARRRQVMVEAVPAVRRDHRVVASRRQDAFHLTQVGHKIGLVFNTM